MHSRSPLLLALAVLAAIALPASGMARTAAPAISIKAKTANKPAGHLVYATYTKAATISGSTVDKQSGTTVELQTSTFPFKSGFTTVAQTKTQSGGSYSFTNKPSVATRYRVALASAPAVQSSVVTVYVATNGIGLPTRKCPVASSCHLEFRARLVYPPEVAAHEGAKPFYDYFGVRYGSQKIQPRRVRLVQTSKQHRDGKRFDVNFSVTFPTTRDYYYRWQICAKDDEAQDGFGLPGNHHCGSRYLSQAALHRYLG